jgi:PAS domain S-box-containing protein
MKKPPSFGRFLLAMVFLLEGLSLAVVIGFLFAMLNRSMKQEMVSRTNVQQAELRLYLTERLNYTQSRVAEIRSNNNIRIGLLVGMDSRIADNLKALYPQTMGSTFYVRSIDGRYFPQPAQSHRFLYDTRLLPTRANDLTRTAVNPGTLVFFTPILQQEKIEGYAVGIYDLTADPHCLKLLKAFEDLSLVYRQGDRFIELSSGRPVAPPSAMRTEALPPDRRQLQPDGSRIMRMGMQEFPSLFLLVNNQLYQQHRHSLVSKLVLLCIPLFLLTCTCSFLILKRVTSTLDALAKNALHIADAGGPSNLDTAKVRHAEFLYLTQAFNKVLSKVRQQTGDLENANENLQKQIEERRQMAQALQASESQLRSLQDNSPIGLYRRSLDGRIIFANPKMLSIFGYDSMDEIMQTPVQQFYFQPGQYEEINRRFETSGDIQSVELRLKRKDGTPIWGAVHLKKTDDPKSASAYIDGAILDITDHKKIEQDNRKLETQLRQTHKMEALGTLAGGIAHDFNNLLYAIIGFCELSMEDAAPDTDQRKSLLEAIACAQRAADLVRRILTFARQSEVEKHPLDLTSILKENLELLRATLPATIDIRSELDSHQTVLADPTQIHQIIVNLCTNAGHAMRATGGVLTIGLDKFDNAAGQPGFEARVKQGTYARLRVEDTGHGMPPETLERIFDPYFTTKPQGEGTGMGLSLVQGIVRSMNGAVCVDSAPGNGTRFCIYLPALEEKAVVTDQFIEPVVRGREHILLVDDELFITRMISQVLTNLGYRVTPYNSPVEALVQFRDAPEQFDLVISDGTMPQMAGYEMAEEMMNIRPDLPVLLCTGYSEEINEKMASNIGARALLYKPLTRQDLSATIRKILDCRPAAKGQRVIEEINAMTLTG